MFCNPVKFSYWFTPFNVKRNLFDTRGKIIDHFWCQIINWLLRIITFTTHVMNPWCFEAKQKLWKKSTVPACKWHPIRPPETLFCPSCWPFLIVNQSQALRCAQCKTGHTKQATEHCSSKRRSDDCANRFLAAFALCWQIIPLLNWFSAQFWCVSALSCPGPWLLGNCKCM